MANFWMSAFRLPGSCLKEIESLCSAFMWYGPDLKTSKAKVSWKDVCLPKKEGGLGLRPLKEINVVLGLKLLWRLFSCRTSLWVRWIRCYLIRKSSFWSMKCNANVGSWMWRKIMKLRDLAKSYLKMEVYNGEHTSFWYDSWSRFGCLKDLLGEGGKLALGITENTRVDEVMLKHRRRRHRLRILNEVEDEVEILRSKRTEAEDIPLWKQREDRFSNQFSTKKTWQAIRQSRAECSWSRGVWFPQSTPKYSFLVWVAIRNRLQTHDRMKMWNTSIDTKCILCEEEEETCQHLFFECKYSEKVWRKLVGGIMKDDFTHDWNEIIGIISTHGRETTEGFLLRYAFQALVHSIWRERNARRHGEQSRDVEIIYKLVDKTIRLKLLAVKNKGKRYLDEGLCAWFGAQLTNS